MKLQIEFDACTQVGLDTLINDFESLRQDHVKATKCPNEFRCEQCSSLNWLIIQLKNIKAQQINNLDRKVWKVSEKL